MGYVIKKRGKYFEGHSSFMGNWKCSWTADIAKARRFLQEANTEPFIQRTGGRVEHVQDHYPEEWGPSDARQLTCVCGDPDPDHTAAADRRAKRNAKRVM